MQSKKNKKIKKLIMKMNRKMVLWLFCRLFERRCIGMMDSMYEEDSKHAINLMDDEAVVWGIYSSPLTFAYENFMYDIVAHTSSQKLMNKQWYNNLAPDLKPFLKVMVMSFGIRDKRLIMNYYICLFFFQNLIYSNFFYFSLPSKSQNVSLLLH